ncbi:MAG: D-alanyl-D-alanine carboxypeptidase [Lachnospiraceae bacterium]|nr:D-alanyl-D-alanine carboxypeptidase [Lachnospiraceae bacterium]
MNYKKSGRVGRIILTAFLYISILTGTGLNAYAAPASLEEANEQAEERKSLPIQSNQIENWPAGPAIGAQSAILMDANTGVILYAKNIDEKLYPASTTKLMTCILAAENCKLDEMIKFSHNAVFSIERGSSNIGIDEGQSMPLEECLYGILVASANEVANAVAEHIAGTTDDFAIMMNQKAAELGCKNTHFTNPHGLFDENHYTSAYDLALIAKAFFQNELLTKIGNTPSHHFQATATQPDDFIERNKHKLITGEIAYEGIKGGKTGYTDEARQTLVTCAEQNGMKLICVVMKEESPEQFYDTVKLFSYGFTNFSAVNVSENETDYSIQNSNFFNTSNDVFGNSKPILTLNQSSYLIMPKTITFDDLDSQISYETSGENEVAVIEYYYHGAYVGNATVDLAEDTPASYDFTENISIEEPEKETEPNVIIVNIKTVLICILVIALILIAFFVIRSIINSYNFLDGGRISKRRRRMRKRNRKDGPHFPSSRFNGFDL